MKKIISIGLIITLVLSLITSCNKYERRIKGTWDVTKVEFTVVINGFTFSGQGEDVRGTINFNKGRGKQDYSFKFNGNTYTFIDTFTYTVSEEYITTSHTDKWLRELNTKKLQKAKYTEIVSENETRTYTLTLEK